MKATCLAFCAALVLLVSGLTARGYALPELDLVMDVPATWVVMTRDVKEDDPGPLMLGIPAEFVKTYLETANIYLNAVLPDYSYELVVTMLDYEGSRDIFNLNGYTPRQLEQFARAVIDSEEASEAEILYSGHSFYEANDVSYVVLDFTRGENAHGRQYATVYNGRSVNITLNASNREISEEMAAELEEIVASARFTQTLPNPNPAGRGIDWSAVMWATLGGAVLGGLVGLAAWWLRGRGKRGAAEAASDSEL